MRLPTNFGAAPGEEPHRFFKNCCIEFKKIIHKTHEIRELQDGMQRLIDATKQMNWHVKTSATYRKDDGLKTVEKVFTEFKRYIGDLQTLPSRANAQDLLTSLELLEQFIDSYRVA